MKNWAKRLFCCSSEASGSSQGNDNRPRSIVPVQRRPTNNGNTSNTAQPTQDFRPQPNPPKPTKKFAKIVSSFKEEDIISADVRPEVVRDVKYNCPICFRYFNHILISSCCGNYLCHECAKDTNERVQNSDKFHTVRCAFCNNEDLEYKDVDPKEKPKRYTDSLYSTFNSKAGEPLFANTLGKSKFNKEVSPSKSNADEDLMRGYNSDGFVAMKRDFENSLKSPAIEYDINTEEKQMSKTADLNRRGNNSNRQVHIVNNGGRSGDQQDEVSEDSFNDRDEIGVIREAEIEQSIRDA